MLEGDATEKGMEVDFSQSEARYKTPFCPLKQMWHQGRRIQTFTFMKPYI